MTRRQRGSQAGEFLRNFNQVYGTVKHVAQDFEVKKIAEAAPEQSQGFTADQGAELEKLAGQGYKIDFDQGQNAYVAKNEAGDTKTVGMGTVSDFLGNRTAGAMSRGQVNNARMLAMSDVIGKNDPARGMQMRQQVKQGEYADKRQAREEKAWKREDDLAAIDADLGQQFKAGLVGEDGKERAPTADDYLGNMQAKIGRYMAGGHGKEAEHAMKEHYAMANIKLQIEGKERENAIAKTIGRIDAGDLSGVADYYNKYLPTGDKLTGVQVGKDGRVMAGRVGADGQALPDLTMGSVADLRTGILKSADYKFAYQISQDQFNQNMKLRAEARADRAEGRAAAAHAASMAHSRDARAERSELRSLRGALAAESNPDLTPTQRRAYELGLLETPGKSSNEKYSYDPKKVRSALGDVSINTLGEQVAKPNPEREARFAEFSAQNPNIRNGDEMLVKFLQHETQLKQQGARQEAAQKQQLQERGARATAADFVNTMKANSLKAEEVADELVAQGVMDRERADALAKEAKKLQKESKQDKPAKPAKAEAPRSGSGDFYGQEAVAQRASASQAAAAQRLEQAQAAQLAQEEVARRRMQSIGQAFQDAYR